MTIAVAPAPDKAPAYRRVKRGWRATPERPFATLGWLVLDWTYAYLPSPADERNPLVYTDEQAKRILEWFRLNPVTGAFVHNRRLHLQEAKGFGKSPFAGSLDLTDFCGPVCFDGWDAFGQPVGVPWGTGERPAPWIQIAAFSEAQTKNTYAAVFAALAANDHRAARDLRIDEGRTRLYLRDIPDAIMEPVTASAGSRAGQRVTKATLDEPQLWTPDNGGMKLARTILDNLTKMDGRAVFTGNAYVIGAQSVAEHFDVAEKGVLRYANRPREEPEQNWPRAKLLASLDEVYGDAHWAPKERIVADATSDTADWDLAKRNFWNIPTHGVEHPWMPSRVWKPRKGTVTLDPEKPVYAAVVLSGDNREAAVAAAQRQGDKVVVTVTPFPAGVVPDDADYLELAPLEAHLQELRREYPSAVWHTRRLDPRLPEQKILAPGPEVLYHSAFFEGSAQHLGNLGVTLRFVPHSHERLRQAADVLMERAVGGSLVHDGSEILARQVGYVVEQPSAAGARITIQAGKRAPAAYAAMVAVHRAVTAPEPPPEEAPVYGSFH